VSAAAPARVRLPQPTIVWVIAGAWVLALAAQASGREAVLHHGALINGTLPFWAALALFLVAWQVMIAAMMLPSSLPLMRIFNRMAAAQPHARRAMLACIGGYALVWTGFGAAAFVFDLGVHRSVDAWPWLAEHSWLIAGGVLVLAGAFQFSSLKQACLKVCRHPGAFLLRHYRRGTAAGLRIGVHHGAFCLGCCWALMLVAFAAGVANLAWMAVFTAIMVFEKTGSGGDRGAAPIGVGLLVLGALVLVHPAWLPPIFATD
jgi:predicted metal-binding membrane protein